MQRHDVASTLRRRCINVMCPLGGVCPSVGHAIFSITTGRNSSKLAPQLPLIVRVCESNINFPSVHPSITLSPSKPLGGNYPNLLHYLSTWLGCATETLFYHLSSMRLSVYLCFMLSIANWTEFNQTCYRTSLHSKGVQE